MKKNILSFVLVSSLISSALFAKEDINLNLIKYKDVHTLKKIDNLLLNVKEDGLTRDLIITEKKWLETNSLLEKLISDNNYEEAYILFKHIDFDKNVSEYKNYLYFFQIINKMNSKHSSFKNIEFITDNTLLTHIFDYFFVSVEKERINDKNIISKIFESLLKIDNANFSFLEKQRVRYKLFILKGNYVQALKILNNLENLNSEDRKYISNIQNILFFMQEHFFVSHLHMTHTEFKDYNLLYRTKQTPCSLNNLK